MRGMPPRRTPAGDPPETPHPTRPPDPAELSRLMVASVPSCDPGAMKTTLDPQINRIVKALSSPKLDANQVSKVKVTLLETPKKRHDASARRTEAHHSLHIRHVRDVPGAQVAVERPGAMKHSPAKQRANQVSKSRFSRRQKKTRFE